MVVLSNNTVCAFLYSMVVTGKIIYTLDTIKNIGYYISMNAVYLCVVAEPWIKVSQMLKKSADINPAYFVCWGNEAEAFRSAFNELTYIQIMQSAWRGEGFPNETQRTIFDEEQLAQIAKYELTGLKMMDRLDPDGESFGFNSRLYFFRDLLGYWMSVVEDKNIDIVISPSIPHRVFDYALYVVCRIKNIKFLTFQMTPFGSRSAIIDNIDKMPTVNYEQYMGEQPSQDIVDRINKVKKTYSEAIPEYMKVHATNDQTSLLQTIQSIPRASYRLLFKTPSVYWVQKGHMPQETNYSSAQFQKMQITRNYQVKSYEKLYRTMVSHNNFNNYILVALHYQPEETSCPTGGSYADQILIVQLLDALLPEEMSIVVKEHKSQFYTHQESASGRDGVFYRRISSISDRVKFASEDTEPFALIDNAKAVITISGTIGWESAIRGTPVMVFGRAWYEGMPRVFKVKTKEEVKNALEQLDGLKNKDLDKEIMAFHTALEEHLTKAIHYKAFLKNTDVSMNASEENIAQKIIQHISQYKTIV